MLHLRLAHYIIDAGDIVGGGGWWCCWCWWWPADKSNATRICLAPSLNANSRPYNRAAARQLPWSQAMQSSRPDREYKRTISTQIGAARHIDLMSVSFLLSLYYMLCRKNG